MPREGEGRSKRWEAGTHFRNVHEEISSTAGSSRTTTAFSSSLLELQAEPSRGGTSCTASLFSLSMELALEPFPVIVMLWM